MDMHKFEMVIQLCRLQVQRERERLMTPKLSGALEALKKLKSFAEDKGTELTKRCEAIEPELIKAFEGAHASVDKVQTGVQDIADFTEALKRTNSGDPLDGSDPQSNVSKLPPRSSEVAQR